MLAVLVNSCDGFADCWPAFFELFERYGGELKKAPIYLNTERKRFSWPGLNIHPTCVWPTSEPMRPTWSACLRKAIESISEPYILYFQEDYFLTLPVDDEAIFHGLFQLDSNPEVGVVYLGRFGPLYTRSRTYNDLLIEVVPPSRYLVSTQCGIWRKEFLLSLLREWENAWQFEIFASRRARGTGRKFLAASPEVISRRPPIDYVYTGIIKGRWKSDCVSLFAKEKINVDFTSRGMYSEPHALKRRMELIRRLTASPQSLLRSVGTLLNT